MTDDDTITTGRLAWLFDVTPKTIADLGKRGIIEHGPKRGTWRFASSVAGYCRHLRAEAAARGGEAAADARARLGQAQASLAEAKVGQLRGELVEAAEVERVWTTKLWAIRNRILAIPNRLRDLSPKQSVVLTREQRDALTELADRGN
jgi:phage terminase Nu1 subunit (DNA packaging protein)